MEKQPSKRYLIVTFSNGESYAVPAKIVADSRATYFAQRDNPDSKSDSQEYIDTYNEEFEYTLNSDVELRDWASNSMDWVDVEKDAIKLPSPDSPYNYQKSWTNAQKDIVYMALLIPTKEVVNESN